MTTSCSMNNDGKYTKNDKKILDSEYVITYKESKIHINDTIIQQTNSLLVAHNRIDLVTKYFTDSVWHGEDYIPIIYEQIISFNKVNDEILINVELGGKIINFKTDNYKNVSGKDNFIYKVFPITIDSGLVFIAHGLKINSYQMVSEYLNVYSSDGELIFNGYENADKYDTLNLFWENNGVNQDEIQSANLKSVVYTF